ncbi:MAG TPA: UvrD-helicase domain-containing protein [Methylomirabilota bacterium]|nr:UvrD-helicase domain-containing protein [Methylomirabilota bacterium]
MSREYVLQPFRPAVDLQIDYAAELNPQQHAAVTALPGPALVIAGAGSGKTRTLTYRVAFLIEQGIAPDRILLLTFTNKAAREMMRRVGDLLGRELPALWGGTFHSIGARILRRHAERLGFRPDFTILDREDGRDLIKACVAEAEIDLKAARFPTHDVLGAIFSMAVNTARPLPEIITQNYPYFAQLTPQIEDLSRRYAARKHAANVMDFDDLLVLWLRLLREDVDLREHYQRRFQFVLVDEYQDTNPVQSELIDLLAGRHRNVMVVGDDSQSIYSWRGADFRNILEFPRRYPGAAIYKIETNYRSTPEILLLANAAIAPNVHQFAKVLSPTRRSGTRPALVACEDGHQQAAFVAQRALELREKGVPLRQMAVLYRSHFHALELQLELMRRHIPFSITSGIRFFEQAHLKDVTTYLKLVCNPRDELAFKRLVRMLPGVGAKAAEKLWHSFNAGKPEPGGVAAALQQCAPVVPKKTATAWANLAITLAQIEAPEARLSPSRMIRLVLEGGYEDYLQAQFDNYRTRLEDLEQLASFALQFNTAEEFLTQLSLLTNLEAESDTPPPADDERIRLSTIHQAKGLEFDVVFIIMLCDGLFPSSRSLENEAAIEEERRLFYVAITRARNELYLSYPLIRFLSGEGGASLQTRSRFLEEVPAELVEEWNLRSYGAGS